MPPPRSKLRPLAQRGVAAQPRDPDAVRPATRQETLPVGMAAVVAGFIALSISSLHGYMLLYGDAVAHLGIARRIIDTNTPGLANLGGVWLPLPHLLMLPFVRNMQWWQNGMAGAWPSLICYVLSVMGMYRLARRVVAPRWALVATAFFGLNANLLYLATTAMTEPLFLAELIWIVLLTMEFSEAVRKGLDRIATNRLLMLGLLILAATMTRYDGWILGAAIWLIAAWKLWQAPQLGRKVLPSFVTFTLLSVAGPIFWFWYNHTYGHDWLDFMRGPYSAKEIDRKTSPPGSHKYWGWHNPAWSLMLYARTAQVDAAAWETGWLVAAAALFGAWKAWFKFDKTALMLWLPLPFYVYSISYGSVPIFIPQLYPHAFYNSRYGMEMLPGLALFMTVALVWTAGRYARAKALATRLIVPVAMLLIVINLIVMLHATPLVLKEAMANSRGRLALEEPMAEQLATFERGPKILMENSDHVGALQKAGIPLKQTIGPDDYYGWKAGLAAPAETAGYVVSIAGDQLSTAIKQHPEGLTELAIVLRDEAALCQDLSQRSLQRIPMKFVKAHACGNDFLIVEEAVANRRHAAMAKKLCARNTSIGADGIEFLDRRADGSFFLRLFNADGSEAELSGNGTRCVAAWLAQSEGLQQVSLGTHGGVRSCKVISSDGPVFEIESGMGVPRVMRRAIELLGVGVVEGAMVNVGNPHYVLFVDTDDFSSHGMSWQELGGRIAVSPLFPHGTNVEFVRVKTPNEIEFRIFERGCGPTTSSGTGTCASSAAAIALRDAARELTAIAEGGSQRVIWPANDAEMMLTGPAEIICTGEVSGW